MCYDETRACVVSGVGRWALGIVLDIVFRCMSLEFLFFAFLYTSFFFAVEYSCCMAFALVTYILYVYWR